MVEAVRSGTLMGSFLDNLSSFMRRCVIAVLSVGPIPNHIAFIMDGNRRFAKKRNMSEGGGHSAGFYSLLTMLRYCYEFGVKYVTVYAFSIDNFKRRPEEVEMLMKLMQEKIEGMIKEESIANRLGVRIYFIGNLNLLSQSVREAAEKAMAATAANSKVVLCICVAYTSTDEIANAVDSSCEEKSEGLQNSKTKSGIEKNESHDQECLKVMDIEKHMYMAVAPDPDILIRTSGEKRLSNFLLWQSANSHLLSPCVLWPEIGFRHLVWAILNFQHHHTYLEKIKKQD